MRKNLNLRGHIALGLIVVFLVNVIGPVPGFAQSAAPGDFRLPAPGVRVGLSPEFNPPILKGIKVHPDNPFRFDFILSKGDGEFSNDQFKVESEKLIKYFLASLTIPENDLWVNLSPYEKDRIIPLEFGLTGMGRDLLAEDYMLKQITASLIYPENEIGKKFWKRIYEEAAKKFGTTNIPVNTFNKVWIVPQEAMVYEHGDRAYVVKAKLKVMLDQDYLALEKTTSLRQSNADANSLGSQVVREIVIPELTKEVNEGKNFTTLRQIYNAMILAAWFKVELKRSILGQYYVDKAKVKGIDYQRMFNGNLTPEQIYKQYLKAFKKGVFNLIKEDFDPQSAQTIPRKYFSGGFSPRGINGIGIMGMVQRNMIKDPAMFTPTDLDQMGADPVWMATVDLRQTSDYPQKPLSINDEIYGQAASSIGLGPYYSAQRPERIKTSQYSNVREFTLRSGKREFNFYAKTYSGNDSLEISNENRITQKAYYLGRAPQSMIINRNSSITLVTLPALGRSLYDIDGKLMTMDEKIALARSLGEGLAALHGAGIVHRDLRAGNIFWDRQEGLVQFIDYGASEEGDSATYEKKTSDRVRALSSLSSLFSQAVLPDAIRKIFNEAYDSAMTIEGSKPEEPTEGDLQGISINHLDHEKVEAYKKELLDHSENKVDLDEAKKEWDLFRMEYFPEVMPLCRFGHHIRWRLSFRNRNTGYVITGFGTHEVLGMSLGLTTKENLDKFEKDQAVWKSNLVYLRRYQNLLGAQAIDQLNSIAPFINSLSSKDGRAISTLVEEHRALLENYIMVEQTLEVLDKPRLALRYLTDEELAQFRLIKQKFGPQGIIEALSQQEIDLVLAVRERLEDALQSLVNARLNWARRNTPGANEATDEFMGIGNASLANLYLVELFTPSIKNRAVRLVLDYGAGQSGFYSRVAQRLPEALTDGLRVIDVDRQDSGIDQGLNPNKVIISQTGNVVSAQPEDLQANAFDSEQRYETYDLVTSNFVFPHLTTHQIQEFFLKSFNLLKVGGQIAVTLPRSNKPENEEAFKKALEEMGFDIEQSGSSRLTLSSNAFAAQMESMSKNEARRFRSEVKSLVEKDFYVLILRKRQSFTELRNPNGNFNAFNLSRSRIRKGQPKPQGLLTPKKFDLDHLEAMHLAVEGLKSGDITPVQAYGSQQVISQGHAPTSGFFMPRWPDTKPVRTGNFDRKMKDQYIPHLRTEFVNFSASKGAQDMQVKSQEILRTLELCALDLGIDKETWDEALRDGIASFTSLPNDQWTKLHWLSFFYAITHFLNSEELIKHGWFITVPGDGVFKVTQVIAYNDVMTGVVSTRMLVVQNEGKPEDHMMPQTMPFSFVGTDYVLFNTRFFDRQLMEKELEGERRAEEVTALPMPRTSDGRRGRLDSSRIHRVLAESKSAFQLRNSSAKKNKEEWELVLPSPKSMKGFRNEFRKVSLEEFIQLQKEIMIIKAWFVMRGWQEYKKARSNTSSQRQNKTGEQIVDDVFKDCPQHELLKTFKVMMVLVTDSGLPETFSSIIEQSAVIGTLLSAPTRKHFDLLIAEMLLRLWRLGQPSPLVGSRSNAALDFLKTKVKYDAVLAHTIELWLAGNSGEIGLKDFGRIEYPNLTYESMDKLWATILELRRNPNKEAGKSWTNLAMTTEARNPQNGGIDLTKAMADVQITRDSSQANIFLDQKSINITNFDGLSPVIINIQPMTDLRTFLGLNKENNIKTG